ncbi:S8 family serine peptidase [Ferruginibacter paludis]|uniref:S8 family serine peptidase n=1 Tax=Ferruginibacter paludis TaxID=1310417 RepID=UPI0025B5D433|nr:S8 family serine peptidase [Ferruginibacter paludis]MDN3658280.1 S8 family serine peptidase [Ferruginibacter paludis]
MLTFLKYLFLLTFIAAGIKATAQQSGAVSLNAYIDFIDADSSSKVNNLQEQFYIGSVLSRKIKALTNSKTIRIQRQLNDSVYIIASDKPVDKSDFNWIKKASLNWKLSPAVLWQQNSQQLNFPNSFVVNIAAGIDLLNFKKEKKLSFTSTPDENIFISTINTAADFNKLLQDNSIIFIGFNNRHPKEELQINDLDLSVNKISLLHSRLPFLDGAGTTISIKENLPDTTDIDFSARYQYSPLAAKVVSSHASIMATMAAGAGNSWYLGKGVANAATITSSDFSNLLPDDDASYWQSHITVQNHSYGVGIENFYGADAAAYDGAALKNDSLLFVFSAGNYGASAAPASATYAGLPGYANISGSFKMAKNIITVGAVDSFENVANASSRGPAYDGRIKPEMVAYGEDGTSGAAALVSGTAAVLQQAYASTHSGSLPSAALIKAILLNSADDAGPKGIDYTAGYGNLNAMKAAEDLLGAKYFAGTAVNNSNREFSVIIPAGISKAKFTLVWNDVPALPNAYKALVNDLDLELQLPATSQSWKPWVLNSFANAVSLSALPIRKRDSLNTVEQITLDNPAAGNYKIIVNGFAVNETGQSFYIAYELDTTNNFSWHFPSAGDNLFPGTANIIRWTTDIPFANARLFYSLNKGRNWIAIDSSVNTGNPYFYWTVPDTTALAVLKMQTNTGDFLTDTFTISKKIIFKTGFNCADSVLYFWNALSGVNSYRLFSLQGKTLQPIAVTSDTQFVFNKINLPRHQFAVAPIIGGKEGVKSYTIDYTLQGVDCYINNFLVDLKNDQTAAIQLQLGTDYLIGKIVFEKLNSGTFIGFKEINAISSLNFGAIDNSLQKGVNTYRARIELKDGRIIYSAATDIFYFKNTEVVIYPNPVAQGHNITIRMNALQNQWIKITDVAGRIVYNQQTNSTIVQLPVSFSKGIYFIAVSNPETNLTNTFKIFVQ